MSKDDTHNIDWLFYLRQHFTDSNFRSIWPSSKKTTARLTEKLDLKNTNLGIELGPATGILTERILKEIPSEAKLITFETNLPSCKVLKQRLGSDPRLIIINQNAKLLKQNLSANQFGDVSFILSGIPFRKIDSADTAIIIEACFNSLKPNGLLVVYQTWFPILHFNQNLMQELVKHFKAENIKTSRLLINLPPLIVYEARKVI